jgi:hypothetical protein
VQYSHNTSGDYSTLYHIVTLRAILQSELVDDKNILILYSYLGGSRTLLKGQSDAAMALDVNESATEYSRSRN